jgi:alanyl aminopeptidase
MKVEGLGWRGLARAMMLSWIALGAAHAAVPASPPTPPAHILDLARPLSYDVQLSIVPSADKFSGKVSIDIDVLQATPIIWLDAVKLDVHRATITVKGRTQIARVIVAKDLIGVRAPQNFATGHATLTLEYDASFERQSQDGLIKIHDQDDWYIATNLESSFARRVVPCFDEVRAKTPWKLTLEVPIGMAAFANQPEVLEETLSATMKRVHFSATAPIPSYLFAFTVGPYDVVDAGRAGRKPTPVRIIVPHGQQALAKYAADVTGRILDLTEEEVALPYPFDKLDVLALPGVDRFGGMENVGLITVQSDSVLASPGHDSPSFQQEYAGTMAHEIAHMWFGDSVTPKSWDDLWLNEAFAEWMTPKTQARINPQWQEEFQLDDSRARGLLADRMLGTHPLRLKDDTSEAADGAFDDITYAKGSAVLRMVEHWMGEERFRDGVRHYLKAHSGGSVSHDDLYAALTAAADPHVAGEVVPMLQGFVDQVGAPGLDVGLQCPEGNNGPVKLDLNQFRFAPRSRVAPPISAAQMPAAEHWTMPICFQYGEGGDYGETCTLLHDAHTSFALPEGERCPDWVVANTDGFGYLIPLLRDPLPQRLDHAPLLANEAVPVLNDARVLVASDALGADSALILAQRFAGNRQPLVELASLRLATAVPIGLVDAGNLRDSYQHFLRKAYGAKAEALGWQAKPGERDADDLLRSVLVPTLADLGADPVLRDEADRLARDALSGKIDLGPAVSRVLATAAANGNQDLFDVLSTAAAKAPSPVRIYEYRALGHFTDPKLLDQALDLALNDRTDVRDASIIFETAAAVPEEQSHVAAYVRAHFDAIDKRFDAATELLTSSSGNLCDAGQRADLERFIATRPVQDHAAFNRVLEKAELCEAGRDLQIPRLKNFLTAQGS